MSPTAQWLWILVYLMVCWLGIFSIIKVFL